MKQETQKVNAKTTNLGVKTVSMMLVIITLFSFLGTALPTLASEMDSNITVKAEKVTYNGHTYQILYSTYAWNEMETYCESQGGYLACVTTAEENEFLYNYVKENNCQSSTVFGFTDNGHEGNWTWVSGEETDYTNWASSEPNGGSSENWANYYSKYTKGQWNDCGYPGSCNFLVEWPYIEDATASVYNSHTYAIYDVLDSYLQYDNAFDAAENYCEALGGHLATIESQEENDYLYKLMLDSGFNNAYFGLTDRETEGVWKWVTGEALEYTNWNSIEPSNSYGTEDYAMFYYKYTDGTWNDGDFNGFTENGGKAFICEWDSDVSVEIPQITVIGSDAEQVLDESTLEDLALLENVSVANDTIYGPSITFLGKTFYLFQLDGTLTLNLGDYSFQFKVDTEDKTIKGLVGANADLGVGDKSTSASTGTDYTGQGEWNKAYQSVRTMYKALTGGTLDNSKGSVSRKNFDALYDSLKAESSNLFLNIKGQYIGYLEFSYESSELIFAEGGLMIKASASGSLDSRIAAFPAAYLTVGLSVDISGSITVAFEDCTKPLSFGTELNAKPALNVGVGLGSKKAKLYIEGGLK